MPHGSTVMPRHSQRVIADSRCASTAAWGTPHGGNHARRNLGRVAASDLGRAFRWVSWWSSTQFRPCLWSREGKSRCVYSHTTCAALGQLGPVQGDQRVLGQRERKAARTGRLGAEVVQGRPGAGRRRRAAKAFEDTRLTRRPAGMIRRAARTERVFRETLVTGGWAPGNKTVSDSPLAAVPDGRSRAASEGQQLTGAMPTAKAGRAAGPVSCPTQPLPALCPCVLPPAPPTPIRPTHWPSA